MKKLIQTLLWLTILFGYSIANAKPTTFETYDNLILGNLASPALVMEWSNQVGAPPGGGTIGYGASADNLGNVYITGKTNVGISGQKQNGSEDYFIAKYGPNYNLLWTKQVGDHKLVGSKSGYAYGLGISADNSGNIYITGYTNRGISGQKENSCINGEIYDCGDYFIARYDVNGNLIWSRQVGVYGGYTFGTGISADKLGNVYVTGFTTVGISGQKQNGNEDYFIAKYDAAGNLIWTKQVGAAGTLNMTQATGISTDIFGNIYITGYTNVGLSGQIQTGTYDYFIAKYDADGNLIWTKQVGAYRGWTYGKGISISDSGNIYVTGYTSVGISGQTQTGTEDYFIAKYDSYGDLLWTRQVGGTYSDGYSGYTYGYGVSAGNSGNVYVIGYTNKGLSGQKQNGNEDYFVARYDIYGNLLAATQYGASGGGDTYGTGVSADRLGNVYVTGYTDTALPGLTQNGYYDYFAVKYLSIN